MREEGDSGRPNPAPARSSAAPDGDLESNERRRVREAVEANRAMVRLCVLTSDTDQPLCLRPRSEGCLAPRGGHLNATRSGLKHLGAFWGCR